MRHRSLGLGVLTGILFLTSIPSAKAVGFDGEFIAANSCQLYTSKNNLTNPDNLFTQEGTSYKIKEANKIPADWYRIEVSGNANSLRWVEANCGFANGKPTEQTDNNTQQGGLCQLTSNKADSYVIAFSLQPAFCEAIGYAQNKPECTHLNSNSPYMKQLSLHGLWPNQDTCGTNYGYCNNTAKQKSHCDYQPLNFSRPDVSSLLKQYMPSYSSGSCLERHEWYKHGSCQSRSVDDYYDLALKFSQQINHTSFASYLASHLGQTITISEFNQKFDDSFGIGSSKKVKAVCTKSLLTDLYIELPNLDKDHDTNLNTLFPLAKNAAKTNCGNKFKLSNFSVN